MTREEAYYILRVSRDEIQSKGHTEFDMLDLPCLDMAIAALREQPRWISVEERKKKKKDSNLNKSILAIEIREGLVREWTWDSVARYPKSFTHWRPLPEPPEVEV